MLKNLLMNHWPEWIDIWFETSWGKGIQVCSIEVPGVTTGLAPRA